MRKRAAAWNSRSVLAAAVLGLLVLLFLGRALLPGQVLLPLDIVTQQWPPWQQPGQVDEAHNPLLSDVVNYIYPIKEFTAAALRQGEFPLWNPYVLTGYPLTYNTQAGLFYPLSLLYLLLPATTAVDLTIILQMVLGGLFMALYLRQIGLRTTAVLAGGILFLFNGLMVVWLEWQVVHAAVIWLPLQLFCIEKLAGALQQQKGREAAAYGVAAAMAMAVPWLGGHWNWTLYISMTSGIYLLARLGGWWRQTRGTLSFTARSWPLFAVPALALALCLVQVLPAALYLGRSHRQELPFLESLHLGLLNRAVALLVPNFFGDPLTRTWWGVDNFNETTFYIGILPLLLALLAVVLRRDWHTRFFAAWGLVGLLLTLGPLYTVLYMLPVFGGLQPNRAAILFVFCATVLAALGLDRLLAPVSRPVRWGTSSILMVITLLLIVTGYLIIYRAQVRATWEYLSPRLMLFLIWLAGSALLLWLLHGKRLPRPWLGAAVVLWLTADLFLFGYDYNPVTPISHLYPPTATTTFLQSDPDSFRIVTPPQGLAFPPNSSLVPRLSNLSGYEPGIPETLAAYVNAAEGGDAVHFGRKLQPQQGLASPLLDALNVKYIVSSHDLWGAAQEVRPRTPLVAWSGLPVEGPLAGIGAGLQRLDLALRGEEAVTLHILSTDGTYEFAQATAVPGANDPDGWTSFYFDPFPAEWGDSFTFRAEGDAEAGMADGGQPASAVFALARPGLALEDGKTRVYRRENSFPRAYYVPRAELAEDAQAALTAVLENQDALDKVVILETMGQDAPPLQDNAPGPAQIAVTLASLNTVTLQADLAQPGFVVLAEAFYPGWRATLDGQKTAVFRANSVSRAVYVPAGDHVIAFEFWPADFYAGALISAPAWAACLALLIWVTVSRRGRKDG